MTDEYANERIDALLMAADDLYALPATMVRDLTHRSERLTTVRALVVGLALDIGITQRQLADTLGWSQGTVSNYSTLNLKNDEKTVGDLRGAYLLRLILRSVVT